MRLFRLNIHGPDGKVEDGGEVRAFDVIEAEKMGITIAAKKFGWSRNEVQHVRAFDLLKADRGGSV